MPNVLYISYDGMTDPLGQSQVLPYLSGLSKRGYSITLISCEKPERYEQHKEVIQKICALANIDWQPIPYTSKPPIISTIKDIRHLHKRAYALHADKRFDIVHCRSYISAMVGQNMKRKFGTKFLFDMRGFWADERVDGGLWNRGNPLYNTIYKFFKKKEKQYLEQADHTISLTYAGKQVIHSWKHVNRQPVPIMVIPCCVDTSLFDRSTIVDRQKDLLYQKLQINKGQFVIGYVGSIGTWYMLDEMLMCFKVLLQKKPDAVMLFVTTEPAEMVLSAVKRLGVPEAAIRITAATRKEVPYYIGLMDLSIFFIKPCFSKTASSPTKQGEIMAMGTPVLCNSGVGDTAFVVDKYHSGIAVNDFTESTFSAALDKMLGTTYDAAEIRKGADDFYSLGQGINSYEAVYKQLLKQP
ncbi:MAG: glycosyltransferase [Sphingobacteriales bacterium]|nr:MAG: glycosyltransferase [Sphingobacteriales bacterium]